MALKFSRLTRPAIRALEIGQRINEHGIIAERQGSGDVRYRVNVMVDGRRIHRVVGRESDGVTREQAERLIEKLRTDARSDRLDLPQGRKLHRTFAQAAPDYLERLERSGGKDMANKRRNLDRHLTPYFGSHRLDAITNFDLKRYRKKRLGEGAKDATINREMATMQHLLRRASSKDWGWIKPEDVPEIDKATEVRKQIRILSDPERTKLLKAAIADQDPLTWLFVMFGLNASMRHSEIVRRRFDEIDFDQCRLWIDKAKAGERLQPITTALRDALLRQREMVDDKDGWIFPANKRAKKYPHRRDMHVQFQRTAERAGLDPRLCTPHIMRHTAITALVKQRVDVPTIQSISGHKTPAMVMHYVHIFGEHIDTAIDGLSIGFSDTVTHELHTAPERDGDEGGKAMELKSGKSAA